MEAIFTYLTNQALNYFYNFTEMLSIYLIPLSIILITFLLAIAFKKKFSNLVITLIHRAISKGPFQVEKASLGVLKKPLQIIFIFSITFLSVALQGELTMNNPGLLPFMLLLYRLSIIISITYFNYLFTL